jgi:hypothetical protein
MHLNNYQQPFKDLIKIRGIVATLLILFLTACVTTRQANTLVDLGHQSQYTLQTVPENLQGLMTLQQLIVTSNVGTHQLLLQTELHQNKVEMVGLSPSGLVLFELSWIAGAKLNLSSTINIEGIVPEVMLAYYQMSNWPVKDMIFGLKGMQVKTSNIPVHRREFYKGELLVFSVLHNPKNTVLMHNLDDYQIEILTLESSNIE